MIERAHERVPRDELYAATGIQTMPINTVFQLLADEGTPALAAAERIALVPDLLALLAERRAGQRGHERVHHRPARRPHAATWARALIERLGLPAAPFAGEPVEPGTTLGRVLAHHGWRRAGPRRRQPRHRVGVRRRAAARPARRDPLLAAPGRCSGWSSTRRCSPTRRASSTSPTSAASTARSGCSQRDGPVAGAGVRGARGATRPTPSCSSWPSAAGATCRCSIPTTTRFLRPGDMPARIAEACRAGGQERARGPRRDRPLDPRLAGLQVPRRARPARGASTGRDVDVVHVIGGGARNELLCRLTADLLGRPVLAGPVEATALGNVLVQARAVGELGSLADMRAVAAASAEPDRPTSRRRTPTPTFQRFLVTVTGQNVKETRDHPSRPLCRARIETPSWGYGDSGTRFATFQQAGRPRDVFERIDDAAEVHRLTGTARAVALHFPWDAVDDLAALRGTPRSAACGSAPSTRTCSRTPTTSSARSRTPTRPSAARRPTTCSSACEIATRARLDRAVAVVRRRHELPRPGRPRERRARHARRAGRGLRGAPGRAGAAARVQAVRARLLRDRPRRLGLVAARVPEARRPREGAGRPRPPPARHEHRADRRARCAPRAGSAASTSTTASTPTTT